MSGFALVRERERLVGRYQVGAAADRCRGQVIRHRWEPVFADRHPHPPEELLAVADLGELFRSSATGTDKVVDERLVKIAARCAIDRGGVEARLSSSGEKPLDLKLRCPVVTVPGSDPHASAGSAAHPARLLRRVELLDDSDDHRVAVDSRFIDLQRHRRLQSVAGFGGKRCLHRATIGQRDRGETSGLVEAKDDGAAAGSVGERANCRKKRLRKPTRGRLHLNGGKVTAFGTQHTESFWISMTT